jgi:membrane-associated phospholipid phosphatase
MRVLAPGAAATRLAVEAGYLAARPDVVLVWNEALLEAIRADRTPAPLAAHNMAMVHAAMYDAVNTIEQTHQPYLVNAVAAPCTSPEMAAAIAAHRVLVSLYPKQVCCFNATLDQCCANIQDGLAKDNGVALGQWIGERMLAWRAGDGADRRATHVPGTFPGAWRPTPPDFRPALLPHWPQVTCFALATGSQFRPRSPPALTSQEFAASFNEVKFLGARDSQARTADQTEIAWFWVDGDGTVTPPGHWNRIAQTVALARGNTLAENARLFALLNIALADAGIAVWDGKYTYNYWRPVHAIREAEVANNPDITSDPAWTPLLPTPAFPSYTSGHSTFSGAAAAVLMNYFGTDSVPFTATSEGTPGVSRSYASFSAAAAEAGRSRIYGGIHWQFDNAEGLVSGHQVGSYVTQNFLLPRTPVVR